MYRCDEDHHSRASQRRTAQRKYAEKLRTSGTPRTDDIGRALLTATRRIIPQIVNIGGADPRIPAGVALMKEILRVALDDLVGRGFDRARSWDRLQRALQPPVITVIDHEPAQPDAARHPGM